MLRSGNGSEMSNQMTFGHAALGEALTLSALSAALPGIEENVGTLVPAANLPQVPESPASTPRKRQLEIEDEEGPPQTPNTRGLRLLVDVLRRQQRVELSHTNH